MPAIKRLPGFRRYEGGVDRNAGRLVAVILWDTEEQAQGLREAIRTLMPEIAAAGVELEPGEVYEVLAQA